MIQTIITIIILAAAVILAVIYFIRLAIGAAKQETECSCCAQNKTCSKAVRK